MASFAWASVVLRRTPRFAGDQQMYSKHWVRGALAEFRPKVTRENRPGRNVGQQGIRVKEEVKTTSYMAKAQGDRPLALHQGTVS